MRLGAEPWCPGPVPTSAEREETSRRGVQATVLTRPWSPQWAGLPQAAFSAPASARGGAAVQMGSIQDLPSPSLSPGAGAQLTGQTQGEVGATHFDPLGGSTC